MFSRTPRALSSITKQLRVPSWSAATSTSTSTSTSNSNSNSAWTFLIRSSSTSPHHHHSHHAHTTERQDKPRIIVYGGNGGLGKVIVRRFKFNGWHAMCVDYSSNIEADSEVVLQKDASWHTNTMAVMSAIQSHGNVQLRCVVNAAGGWVGGNISDPAIVDQADRMYEMNVRSALSAAHVASKCLQPNGLVVLTGAAPCLEGTPNMLAYGISKASIHHMVKSLAVQGSGLPEGTQVAGILPVTIDTPSNRSMMPNANFADWTPPEDFAQQILQWAEPDVTDHNKVEKINGFSKKPENGGLYQFITTNGMTKITPARVCP